MGIIASNGSSDQSFSIVTKCNSSGLSPDVFFTQRDGNNSQRNSLTINKDGNIGINEPNPQSNLVVRATTDDNPGISLYRLSGGGDVGSLNWQSNTITNLGKINYRGGGGSEGMQFSVYDGSSALKEVFRIEQGSGNTCTVFGNSANIKTEESGGATVKIQSGGSQGYIGTETNHHLSIRTNNTLVANFTEDGDMMIMHPTNSNAGQILGMLSFSSLNTDCFQNQEDCYRINFWENQRNTTSTRTDNSNASIRYNASTSDGGDGSIRFANEAGTRILYMNRLGNGGTSGTWNVGSDQRKKDNIATVTDALDKVNQLRGVDFDWKERYGGHADSGVIAQEVESVLPHLVITQDGARDKDDDGNVVNMKQMNYNGLWGVMIEAIKELTARVEELEK